MTLHEAALKLIELEQGDSGMFELDEDTLVELVECLKSHLAGLKDKVNSNAKAK